MICKFSSLFYFRYNKKHNFNKSFLTFVFQNAYADTIMGYKLICIREFSIIIKKGLCDFPFLLFLLISLCPKKLEFSVWLPCVHGRIYHPLINSSLTFHKGLTINFDRLTIFFFNQCSCCGIDTKIIHAL